MLDQLAREREIKSERVYVVYDEGTGQIVHVHQVTTYRGGKALSQREEKARALVLAKRFGHRADGLQVLNVEPGDLNLSRPQRVDLKTRRLIKDDMQSESGR